MLPCILLTRYRISAAGFLLTCLASVVDVRRPPRGIAGRVPGLPSYVTVDGFNMARDGLRPMYTAQGDDSRVPGRYVVIMKDSSGSDAVQHLMRKYKSAVLTAQSEGRRLGMIDRDAFRMENVTMEMSVLKGFAVEITPNDVLIMRTMSEVDFIEESQVFEMQHADAPWHLDRIDQQDLPLDGQFNLQPDSDTLECAAGYQLFGDSCFKAFNRAKSYSGATAVCAADGGVIAVPRNRAVNDFLINLKTSLNPRVRFWIGLTDREKEGRWRWSDGGEVDRDSFSSWADGEPNSAGSEDCAVVEVNSKWNDVPCRLKYRFICQRPASVTRPVYHGCYRDGGSGDVRDLTGDVMVDEERLTPRSCLSHCASKGYRYAGLQYGKECFCGDTFGQFGAAPESDCSTPCTGDAAETCGGNWRNSVYGMVTGYMKQGSTFYRAYSEAKTHSAARETCAADGGHLVDIRTKAVHDFLVRLARAVDPERDYWIGLNDQAVEGSWVWSDGSVLKEGGYANWARGEPNNRNGDQSCGQLWSRAGFLWDDENCEDEDYFICQIDPRPDECLLGDGSSYRGVIQISQSGHTCQCWDSQSPHNHLYQRLFPSLGLDENFCRNPGGGSKRPWCYTTDPEVRWEHCNIPRCDSVDVYIVDSGIRYSHEEFQGRADWSGFDAFDDSGSNKGNDLEGHGTHVAALVGGRTYGVNPRVLLRSVRVLDNRGRGSTFTVLGGLNHIYDKIRSNRTSPGVVVMSLSSRGVSRAVNMASRQLALLGLPVVVAAGNGGDDACMRSPGGEAEVITVGGTSSTDELYDRREHSPPGGATAHGSCVDLFAPAQDVLSAGADCDNCSTVLSGTSQAAPITAVGMTQCYDSQPERKCDVSKGSKVLVDGVVTKLLSRDPSMTPAQIRMALLSTAAADKLDFSPLPEDSKLRTPNKLVQSPSLLFEEPAACRTVWSIKSGPEKGSPAAAACNVNETMMSCSSVSDGVYAGEFPLDIPNGRQVCIAQNGQDGGGVYALARCCIWPGSPKCYFKKSNKKSSRQGNARATAVCNRHPEDVLTGCSAFGEGGAVNGATPTVPVSDSGNLKRCTGRNGRGGGRVEAHAFCCRADNIDCWVVRSEGTPSAQNTEVVARCPDHSVLTGCSAYDAGGHVLGARPLDRTCIAHKDSSAQGVQAYAICCAAA